MFIRMNKNIVADVLRIPSENAQNYVAADYFVQLTEYPDDTVVEIGYEKQIDGTFKAPQSQTVE